MDDDKEILFSINDKLLGEQLSPDNISLPLLTEFTEQVATFLRGSNKVDLKGVKVSIKEGSFGIAVHDAVQTLEPAVRDYEKISRSNSLQNIDPLRARIVAKWQEAAKRNDDRVYKLFFDSLSAAATEPLVISSDTNYEIRREIWVNVEKYVYGKIYDLGGKSQPNVHLELDNGKTIKIQAKADLLAGDKVNRLYRRQLVRLRAQQNILTKEYRDETLVSFEYYEPHFNEDEFSAITKKARLAWRTVENATQWTEELRGNYA